MNELGWLILGSIAHATGFAVIGVYGLPGVTALCPAAGALAAASTHIDTALVSVIVSAPGRGGGSARRPRVIPSRNRLRCNPNASRDPHSPREETVRHGTEAAGQESHAHQIVRRQHGRGPSWMGRFLSELRRPVAERERPRWSWPAWVALGFFASAGLGLARLGLGVWSIQRLRALSLRSRIAISSTIRDSSRRATCTKVEIRESAELATPATIGWRRPLVALTGRLARLGRRQSAGPCSRTSWHTSVAAIT